MLGRASPFIFSPTRLINSIIHEHSCKILYIVYNMTNFGRAQRHEHYLGRAMRIWYLSPMRAAKVQASLRIRAVSPEPSLLAHTSSESRGTYRQKARSLAPLNGWACAVEICHDGMLEDTNSLDGAHLKHWIVNRWMNDFFNPFNMCGGSAWRGKRLFMKIYVHFSIETVVYACEFSSNWKIFFSKFWDDPVQTQKQARNI